MAIANRNQTDPFVNFRFRVDVEGLTAMIAFSEVTIPDSSTEAVDYRNGTDPNYKRKLSGLNNSGNITLKRGMTINLDLYNWRRQVELNGALNNRKNISIALLDEVGSGANTPSTIIAQWNIVEAWPTKYESSGLNALSNEVVIETLELVHEGIVKIK